MTRRPHRQAQREGLADGAGGGCVTQLLKTEKMVGWRPCCSADRGRTATTSRPASLAILYLTHLTPQTPTTVPRRATARPYFASCACQRSFANFIFVSSEQDNEDGSTGSSGDDLPVASSPIADHLLRAPPPPGSVLPCCTPPLRDVVVGRRPRAAGGVSRQLALVTRPFPIDLVPGPRPVHGDVLGGHSTTRQPAPHGPPRVHQPPRVLATR